MSLEDITYITVKVMVNAPMEKVWKCWTSPEAIVKWNQASDDWHTTRAEVNLRVGGKFLSRMEAKDGSVGFDFYGEYTTVKEHELIETLLGDDRKVTVTFAQIGDQVEVSETFGAETENSIELQRTGWQMILNNFKKYTES